MGLNYKFKKQNRENTDPEKEHKEWNKGLFVAYSSVLFGLIMLIIFYLSDDSIEQFDKSRVRLLGACGLVLLARVAAFRITIDNYRLKKFPHGFSKLELTRKILGILIDITAILILLIVINEIEWFLVFVPLGGSVVGMVMFSLIRLYYRSKFRKIEKSIKEYRHKRI